MVSKAALCVKEWCLVDLLKPLLNNWAGVGSASFQPVLDNVVPDKHNVLFCILFFIWTFFIIWVNFCLFISTTISIAAGGGIHSLGSFRSVSPNHSWGWGDVGVLHTRTFRCSGTTMFRPTGPPPLSSAPPPPRPGGYILAAINITTMIALR